MTGSGGSSPYGLTAFGDYLYFAAYDNTNGYELWRTNGTTTTLVHDIRTGSDGSYPDYFTALGDYPGFEAVRPIARLVIDDYTSGAIDRVFIGYQSFVNTAIQRPTLRQLPGVVEIGGHELARLPAEPALDGRVANRVEDLHVDLD